MVLRDPKGSIIVCTSLELKKCLSENFIFKSILGLVRKPHPDGRWHWATWCLISHLNAVLNLEESYIKGLLTLNWDEYPGGPLECQGGYHAWYPLLPFGCPPPPGMSTVNGLARVEVQLWLWIHTWKVHVTPQYEKSIPGCEYQEIFKKWSKCLYCVIIIQ